MKINSEKLFDFINNLGTDEKVKFKVYYDDVFTGKEIFWDGKNFIWESGTFASGMFFNPLFSFEEIEENKDIKELEIIENFDNYYIVKDGKQCQLSKHDTVIIDKINELVRDVNKMRMELKKE